MKIGFDYDQTLNTTKGMMTAKLKKKMGDELFIISARHDVNDQMKSKAHDLGIPLSNVFATGSNLAKVKKVFDLDLNVFYDNNPDVIDQIKKNAVKKVKAILFN